MKHIIRIFKFAKPWRKYLITASMALFFASVLNLFNPYIVRQIIAIMESNNFETRINEVVTLALLYLMCLAVRAVCQFISSYCSHLASWQLVGRMRGMVYDKFQMLSMSYFSDKQTGQLMSRVVNDTSTFENLIAHAIPDITTNILTLIGVFSILMFINPYLTILVCLPIPFLALLSITLRRIRRYFRQGQVKVAELNAILQDNFSGIKEIQVFNKQQTEYERVNEKALEYSAALIKALFYSAILNPSVGFITSLGTVIVLIASPFIAINSGLNISDVVAFLLYLNLFYAPVSTLTRVIEDMQMALAGAERVFEVLDTESEIKDDKDAVDVGNLKGSVDFKNVTFAYKDGINVLDNISFHVNAGEMIAIVGPTGVGKSTISGLIARFYDPNNGVIEIDGVNIRSMTLKSLRNQLSLVLQDVFLFNGTIGENIAYGCENVSQKEIEEAAKIAYIDKFIDNLPEKYNTIIGERGVRLSGGQKQRISIARSILRNSPILILDEATSAVDTETELEIQKAINKIAGSRTLIVIAHRLSTVKKANTIIVLKDGKIVEKGNHNELLELNGEYTNLCEIQTLE